MNKRLKLDDLASKDFFMLEMGVKIFGQQLSMNKRRQVFDLTSKSFFMMQKKPNRASVGLCGPMFLAFDVCFWMGAN